MAGNDGRAGSVLTWGGLLLGGVIAVVLGLIIVFNPFDSVRSVTVLVGVAFAVAGLFGIAAAFRGMRRLNVWAPFVVLVGGIVLIAWPEGSVKTLAVLVGIILLAFGALTVAASATQRQGGGWGTILVGTVLAALGLVVIIWPGPSVALMAVLVGVSVLVCGVALIAQGLRLRGRA